MVDSLGYKILGFDIVGDKGTTATKEETKSAILRAKSGSIIILHMNHPEKPCAEGALEAIEEILKRGFRFVKVLDYDIE